MQLISLEEKSLLCLHCNHTPVSQKYETSDGERGGHWHLYFPLHQVQSVISLQPLFWLSATVGLLYLLNSPCREWLQNMPMLPAPAGSAFTWSPGGCRHKSAKSWTLPSTAAVPASHTKTKTLSFVLNYSIDSFFLRNIPNFMVLPVYVPFLWGKRGIKETRPVTIKHQGRGQGWRVSHLFKSSNQNTVQ